MRMVPWSVERERSATRQRTFAAVLMVVALAAACAGLVVKDWRVIAGALTGCLLAWAWHAYAETTLYAMQRNRPAAPPKTIWETHMAETENFSCACGRPNSFAGLAPTFYGFDRSGRISVVCECGRGHFKKVAECQGEAWIK